MWFQGELGNWQSVLCYGVLFFKDLVERCWHLVQSCSVEIPPGLEGQAPDCLLDFIHPLDVSKPLFSTDHAKHRGDPNRRMMQRGCGAVEQTTSQSVQLCQGDGS